LLHRTVTVECDTIIGPCHRLVTNEKSLVTVPLRAGNDGTWTLDLAVHLDSSKLSGNAYLIFPNGDLFPFKVPGKYLKATQQASLVLTGVGLGKGATFQLLLSVPTMSIQSISGKVAGQKLQWRL